jgi:hypothetical protein
VSGGAYLSLRLAPGDLKHILGFVFDGHVGPPSLRETSVSLQQALFHSSFDFRCARTDTRGWEWNSPNHQENDNDDHNDDDRADTYVHARASSVNRTSPVVNIGILFTSKSDDVCPRSKLTRAHVINQPLVSSCTELA